VWALLLWATWLTMPTTPGLIVFRPDQVQGLGSGFWLGWPCQFFKSKRHCFSKKQKSTGCKRVFDRVNRIAGSHQVFSSTRPGSTPGSRVDPPSQVSKLCLGSFFDFFFLSNFLFLKLLFVLYVFLKILFCYC